MTGQRKNRHTVLLLALALGMFGFAFALVPLYDVFCEVTGINGKTSAQAERVQPGATAATGRAVTIHLLANVARGMPWEFRPTTARLTVRVGEMQTATYFVRNRSDGAVTGQAVPSVSPGQAAVHLKKLECFCFERQVLPGGGEMEMPVSFYVADDLPRDIDELSLSYTLFRVDDVSPEPVAEVR